MGMKCSASWKHQAGTPALLFVLLDKQVAYGDFFLLPKQNFFFAISLTVTLFY